MDINVGKILKTATETVKGVVELATPAEVLAGTDNERAVTPAGFKAGLEAFYPSDALNAPYEAVEEHGTLSANTTIDCSDGNIVTCTIGAAITFTLNPNCLTGFCRTLTLIITNGGAYVITWPASVKWAGGSAPTFTASGVDIVTLMTVDAGTTWYGSANGVSYA